MQEHERAALLPVHVVHDGPAQPEDREEAEGDGLPQGTRQGGGQHSEAEGSREHQGTAKFEKYLSVLC